MAALTEIVEPTLAGMGFELVRVALSKGGTLQIMIEPADGRTLDVEDCATVSRAVSAVLDVEDPITSQYTLEVSSPGIDRPLFTAEQFGRFVGEQAKLTLRMAQDGRRRFIARITGVEGDVVLLAHEAGDMRVPHDNIEKARLVPDLVALGLAAQPKPTGPGGTRRKAKKES